MMEDAGEDVLRQKPSMVVTFFKRIGQVYKSFKEAPNNQSYTL